MDESVADSAAAIEAAESILLFFCSCSGSSDAADDGSSGVVNVDVDDDLVWSSSLTFAKSKLAKLRKWSVDIVATVQIVDVQTIGTTLV